MNYEDLKPTLGEQIYCDWDEEFSCWGVFGIHSGFCYAQFYRREEGEFYVAERKHRA